MGNSYITNPQAKTASAALASNVAMSFGYNVSQNRNGDYCFEDKSTGVKVYIKLEDGDTIWDVKAKIDKALAQTSQEQPKSNIITKWKNEYLQSSEEASQAAKYAKVKENYFAELLANAKGRLDDVLAPYKEKFNVKNTKDLENVGTQTLGEERALCEARDEAEKCNGDIAEFAKLKRHYNILRGDYNLKAFMDACSAMKFSYMG